MRPEAFPPVIRAAGWMGGALLSLLTMAIAGRQLSAELITFQILFLRSLIGLVIIAVVLQRAGWAQIKTRVFGVHLGRNLAHFGGQYGWFYAIGIIPLTEVFAIEFTTPIWTAILATLCLGERMTSRRALAVALGFIGTLIILRPGVQVVSLAALAVLAGAVCYAISYVLMKRLSSTETPLSILFYMSVIQLPLSTIPALQHWVWPSAHLWPWIVLLAITGLTAHYCITRAFRLADATVVVPMDFVRLPLIAVVGWLFYGEHVQIWVYVGALFVFAATWLNITGGKSVPAVESIA